MKVLSIILGVLLVIGGFWCLFTPGATFLSLFFVVGILLLVAGIGLVAGYFGKRKTGGASAWELVAGILTILLGALVLFNHFTAILTEVFIVYLFAAWLLIGGIFQIVTAVGAKKLGGSRWVWILIVAILSIILGIYGFFNPIAMAFALGYMVGFYIIMQGFNMIVMAAATPGGKAT